METFLATLSTNRFFLIQMKYASIRSSCILWRCELSFIYSEISLYCVEPTKIHQFDLVLTDTENMMSHYVGLCQNTKT